MGMPTVVVIGGGATGTGILRDLAMRGIRAVLLEQGDLASGTSSRFHGLLHSGARYAVGDPDAARECIAENAVLRRIGGFCVEDTEGWFVRTPEDDPAFEHIWLNACARCGIAVTPVSLGEARRREPNLTRGAGAVYRVPDAAVDGFRLVWHNAMSARRHGAAVRTYTRVTGIDTAGGRVRGVWAQGTRGGDREYIPCDYCINATGSWAGEAAKLAGIKVNVAPDRGTLLAFNHRFTDRVVNRLRKASDGDIFVPHGSITIFGTTSVPTDRPDDTTPTAADVQYLLSAGEALFPKLREYRMLRAFAGTRPLYSPGASAGRGATRNFVILDHGDEGLPGLLTVTGGKFTSFRLMAEKVCDHAAAALGISMPCRTAVEPIISAPDPALVRRAGAFFPPGGLEQAVSRLGDDLEQAVGLAEKDPWKKLLLCECELVTMAEFETVAQEPTSRSLGDIRRRTRLGMGTCQGSFCSLRATGALVEGGLLSQTPPQDLFRQFLEERWHGIRPLLWGNQLREIELERGIYGATLNIDGECGVGVGEAGVRERGSASCSARGPSPLAPVIRNSVESANSPSTGFPENTAPAGSTGIASPPPHCGARRTQPPATAAPAGGASPVFAPDRHYDAIVVGAGFSGLIAAATAAGRGKRTLLVSRGAGALTIGGGTVDLLGYTQNGIVGGDPFAAMASLPPEHPYRLLGPDAVRESLRFLAGMAAARGLPLLQTGSEQGGNAWLPTAAGTMKPSWLTGPGMDPVVLAEAKRILVAGVMGMKDFSPQMAAAGLAACPQFAGKILRHATLPSPLAGAAPMSPAGGTSPRDGSALDLARFMDTPKGVAWLRDALQAAAGNADTVLLPSILGTKPRSGILAELEERTGLRFVELFCPPPSVTGLRMHAMLMETLRDLPVSFVENVTVTRALTSRGRCSALAAGSPGRERVYHADAFIIATGGLFSEGVLTRPGEAREAVFGLPLPVPAGQDAWSCPKFFDRQPHPFARMGVAVNAALNPVGPDGCALFDNVHFVGRSLAGYDFATEKSGSGVALATGHFAGMRV